MEKEIKQCLTDIRDFCGDLKSKLVAAIEDTGWKTLNSQIQYRRKKRSGICRWNIRRKQGINR